MAGERKKEREKKTNLFKKKKKIKREKRQQTPPRPCSQLFKLLTERKVRQISGPHTQTLKHAHKHRELALRVLFKSFSLFSLLLIKYSS